MARIHLTRLLSRITIFHISYNKIYASGKEKVLSIDYFTDIQPHIIIFWDLETISMDSRKQKPIIIAFNIYIYNNSCIEKLMEETTLNWDEGTMCSIVNTINKIAKKQTIKKVEWWAHNAANFDNFFIIPQLLKLDNNLNIIKAEETELTRISANISGVHHSWNDSFKLLNLSLDKLAKVFHIKEKGIFPYKTLNQNWLNYCGSVPGPEYFSESLPVQDYKKYVDGRKLWDFDKELRKYCKLDVSILSKSYFMFIEEIKQLTSVIDNKGVEIIGLKTISQVSLYILVKLFYKHYITINWQDRKALSFITSAIYGGRCEIFNKGGLGSTYSVYDVNSMYPYVSKQVLPVSTGMFVDNYTLCDEIKAFCYVNVEAPDMKYPILPYRDEDLGIIYPTGIFSGFYYSDELLYASRYGYKIKIVKAYVISSSQVIFKDYVDFFFTKKKFATGHWGEIAKLLLNSLTGKWAQKNGRARLVTKEPKDKLFTEINLNELDQLYLIEDDRIKYPLNPAITAAINSLARIELHKYIIKYEPAYVDTDSFFTDKNVDYGELNTELGGLKQVSSNKAYYFHNIKQYINLTDQKPTFKGIKNFTFADWLELSAGQKVIKPNYFQKSIHDLSIKIDSKVFTSYSEYNKRIVDSKTGITTPICLDKKKIKINKTQYQNNFMEIELELSNQITELLRTNKTSANYTLYFVISYGWGTVRFVSKKVKTDIKVSSNMDLKNLFKLILKVYIDLIKKYDIREDEYVDVRVGLS